MADREGQQPEYQRKRGEHQHDDEIRRLREAGLGRAEIVHRTGLSRPYLERAFFRIQFGANAELERRRAKVREYRERKREREAREQAQLDAERKAAEARRAADRERANAWARANPELQRERVERWTREHPERRREIAREWYARNKDKHLQRMRTYNDAHPEIKQENAAKWRAENREYRAELQRRYRSDPEVNARVLAANRERRQLIRRLEKAGLPPKSLHPGTAKGRRANETAATEFFSRLRTPEERRRLQKEYVPPSTEMIKRWERRSAAAKARRKELEAVRAYVAHHGDRLRDEATLDSRARIARGATPLDVDAEVERRARDEVRRAGGQSASATTERRRRSEFDTGPHRVPGISPYRSGRGLN
jgi:hypothetical protein